MSFFEGAQHTTILGGLTQIAAASGSTVNYHQATEHANGKALNALSAAAAHTAMHDSAARSDAPRCHRNTRAKYRDNLEQWMLGGESDYNEKRLIWLHGGAGVGKSAIMQSVIEQCAQHAVVLGSFFFFRSDPSRNFAEVLIPTLSYQLACLFPAALAVLEPIINRNPLIFKASLRTQAYELLVRPILYLFENGIIDSDDPRRRVFVIDGLDECSDPQKQALIINVVASILCDHHVPVSFLIASRPELAISSAFHGEKRLDQTFALISLDNSIDAGSDIRQFIEDSFLDILDSHPWRRHIKSPWPNPNSVDHLVRMSSGHFIYAATAMKFIAASDEHPERALHVVEGLQPSRTEQPFAQLDALYLHILSSAKYSNEVLKILRHCHLTSFEPSVAAVCYIHDISPKDVELCLSDVQSLVFLSPSDSGETYIEWKHASLGDFVWDEKRSQMLYTSREEYHASLLKTYFRMLDNGPHASISTFINRGAPHLIFALAEAIIQSQDVDLLLCLVDQHCPQDIWNFSIDSCANFTLSSIPLRTLRMAAFSVDIYVCAIRDSIVSRINDLYFHQFEMYMQLVLDDINQSVDRQPQYCVLPALMFSSSSPSELHVAHNLLGNFRQQFHTSRYYGYYFNYLTKRGSLSIHPQSFEAVRCLPQNQLAWGAELAIAMALVLRELVGLLDNTELYYNPHRQWLRQAKPRKLTALGSLKLSSTSYSHFYRLMRSDNDNKTGPIGSNLGINLFILARQRGYRIHKQRWRCRILLKAVTIYLHKSDRTSKVVKLARRLLPKAALWHPKLMRRVRTEMDAYVNRWEESPDGILEKTQLLFINDVD
ncbi:hypothetical protein D9619_006140 [Psilocybe cf. subviscida]|uniref:NACHT domain-containing protein n=1 Tax=Psilocybe cf. subviscida TaxID=2480587 RepID=A0A8H5EXJ0_9AGAR|nr:hypothetical protein D9619_006140 [Psilocybe cf. subviscida]